MLQSKLLPGSSNRKLNSATSSAAAALSVHRHASRDVGHTQQDHTHHQQQTLNTFSDISHSRAQDQDKTQRKPKAKPWLQPAEHRSHHEKSLVEHGCPDLHHAVSMYQVTGQAAAGVVPDACQQRRGALAGGHLVQEEELLRPLKVARRELQHGSCASWEQRSSGGREQGQHEDGQVGHAKSSWLQTDTICRRMPETLAALCKVCVMLV